MEKQRPPLTEVRPTFGYVYEVVSRDYFRNHTGCGLPHSMGLITRLNLKGKWSKLAG